MLLEKIWGLIRILRPEISIFGMLCVYIGAIASGSDLINYDIIMGMLAVFFIFIGVYFKSSLLLVVIYSLKRINRFVF